MLRAYKYPIYPTESQKIKLAKTFGCVRFLWNKNVETYQNKGEYKSSTEYRSEFDFLKEVSAAAIQQKEIDFKEFKKQKFSKTRKNKLGAPKFKSRKNRQTFRLPNQKFKLIGNKLQLEKIGKIRIVMDRPTDGKFMSVTVSKDTCGDYLASILVETLIEELPKTKESVGIDVGLKSLITTSDGLQVDRLRDNQTKTKHTQRRLAKKKKGSCRREKLKHRLVKLRRKQARRRSWLLHNISKHLVERYDTIVVEDLNVSGMMKNHKLAGAISDASWSELVRMIDYKCQFYGKRMTKINPFFPSSKTCNQCGLIKEDLKLSDRVFKCECGFELDRDLNAALNILKAGGVAPANQTVMGRKTCEDLGLTQAIPSDLLRLL
jgi:putative transposase